MPKEQSKFRRRVCEGKGARGVTYTVNLVDPDLKDHGLETVKQRIYNRVNSGVGGERGGGNLVCMNYQLTPVDPKTRYIKPVHYSEMTSVDTYYYNGIVYQT